MITPSSSSSLLLNPLSNSNSITNMSGSEPFTMGLHNPYATDTNSLYKPIATASPTYQQPSTTVNGGESAAALPQEQGHVARSEPVKKKRGRPRKYGPDGAMALGLAPTPTTPPVAVNQNQPGGAFSQGLPSASGSDGVKKGRGRPRGSVNKLKNLGSVGVSFTPHVITVKAGEDLSARIMSLSQNGPRNICILTANGAISNVTLRQPPPSSGTVTYEGRFEILSLGGSMFVSENGQCSRYGGLSVSLSGPDGRVLGGGVAGLLIAASPVQIVLASFASEGHKGSKSANRMGNVSAPPKVSTAGQSSSPSRGTLSESSGGPGSPLNQSTGACNNNNPPQSISGMPWK